MRTLQMAAKFPSLFPFAETNMSQETPTATPHADSSAPALSLSADPAEAMRQRVLALIEDQRIALRGFAENATTTALKDLAAKIKALPTR